MSVIGHISHKFNSHRSLPTSLAAMRIIAIVGIAIASATLLVALSIVSGFQREYRRSILDFNAHVVVLKSGEMENTSEVMSVINKFKKGDERLKENSSGTLYFVKSVRTLYHLGNNFHDEVGFKIESHPKLLMLWSYFDPRYLVSAIPEKFRVFFRQHIEAEKRCVIGVTPFLYREGLAISNGVLKGIVIKGIDPYTVRDVNQMRMDLFAEEGAEDDFDQGTWTPKIILGKALAERLKIPLSGDSVHYVTLMIPREDKKEQFVSASVAGTFESGLYDYDSQFALMSLDDIRNIFGVKKVSATGIELKLDDPDKADLIVGEINNYLPAPYESMTWGELNRDLFDALSLEKLVFVIIMGIFVIVSALNIIGVIVLLICYRLREVAILKALGVNESALKKIFTRGGLATGFWGVAIGIISGLLIALAVKHFKIIHLEPEVYFLSTLPIDISWLICGMISVFGMFMCWMTSKVAAKQLAKTPISEALKF